jgi:hypothetical protein
MTGPKPIHTLAKLHDAYGKHAPTVLVGVATVGGTMYDQYTCSCGCVFWDSEKDGTPTPLSSMPTGPWARAVYKLYDATKLGKRFRMYWLRHQKHAQWYVGHVFTPAFGKPKGATEPGDWA